MTAMDVFRSFAACSDRIGELEEMIRRRESAATGGSVRPLTADGGSRGSGDVSMRLLDYVGNVEELREELRAVRQSREEDRRCALYLAELLPGALSGIMSRVHLDGMTQKEAAEAMGYSVSHARRLLKNAEDICRGIQIVSWDREHVPVLTFPEGAGRE